MLSLLDLLYYFRSLFKGHIPRQSWLNSSYICLLSTPITLHVIVLLYFSHLQVTDGYIIYVSLIIYSFLLVYNLYQD